MGCSRVPVSAWRTSFLFLLLTAGAEPKPSPHPFVSRCTPGPGPSAGPSGASSPGSGGSAGGSYPSRRGRGRLWWVRVRRAKAASAVAVMAISQAVLWSRGLKVAFRVNPAARLVWREP
ncbi:hypothetical protein SGRIM128S_05773 [Streptomyces griseomycini]